MKTSEKESKWINPAVNIANDTVDFRKAKVIYFAEMNNTIIDSDTDLRYLKAQCLRKNRGHIDYYALTVSTGKKEKL